MKSTFKRLAVATATVLALAGCGDFDGVYDLPLPGNEVASGEGFVIQADFADALNVVPRTAVMVADVPVGQVEEVDRIGWHARLTLRIRDDVDLPDNAIAEIRQTSLLGEKFVALLPPTSDDSVGRLSAGDVIPMASTGQNPEVEEVLGALSFLLSGGGVGQLQTITQELNAMMEGRTGKIKSVLDQANTLVGSLDTQRDDIIGALEGINGLSKTLVAEKESIGEAIDAVGPAVAVLREQHTQLVSMLSELDKLGEVGTRVVNETKDDLVAELRHLEPVLRELANTGDSLVPGLTSALSYPFPIFAADTIKGDFANVVFKMQFKLTPISEGGLIPTTLPELETLCRGVSTAPLCAPAGEAIAQLCNLLGTTLPLCDEEDIAEVTAALQRAEALSPESASPDGGSVLPDLLGDLLAPNIESAPTGTPAPGGTFLEQLLSGLLGGGN